MKTNKCKNPYERFSKFAINVLKQVERGVPINEIIVKGYTAEEIAEFIYLCAKSECINCLDYFKTADGTPHIEFAKGLTIEGYKFLNEMYADSARKSARKANITSIISLVISFLTLLICFVTLICEYFTP